EAVLQIVGLNTFDGVTLDSDLTLEDRTTLYVVNGMTLNAVVTLANTGSFGNLTVLRFEGGAQTLSGTGQIVFGGSGTANNYLYPSAGSLIIAPSITIHGGSGTIGDHSWKLVNQGAILADAAGAKISVAGNPLINEATILASAAGAAISVTGDSFINRGMMEGRAGTVLTLDGSWSNEGLVRGTDSTLNLKGKFTNAGMGKLERSGGAVKIGGILDNTGATLALNATTGSWGLESGTIRGGTVSTSGGALLQIFGVGTFDGVTLD